MAITQKKYCGKILTHLKDLKNKISSNLYMSNLSTKMQSVKSTSTTPYKKPTEEENYLKAESYGDIKLNFGKYKGMTLNKILADDKGTDYLRWLHDAMKKDEKKKSPTQLAIMKFIFCVVGV